MRIEPPKVEPRRFSVLAALVLLAYGLVRVVPLPAARVDLAFLGLAIRFEINATTVMLVLAACLAVAGADWIVRSHPVAEEAPPSFEHWVIPGLAALAMGGIVVRLPYGAALGLGLALSALLLVAVVQAEFVVLDRRDPRFDAAAISLRALAWFLLIGALFAIRVAVIRAVFTVPFVFLSAAAVAWRLLRLDEPASSAWLDAALVGLVTSEVSWGLHYWRISPLRDTLLLGLLAYLCVGGLVAFRQKRLVRARMLEFGAVATVSLLAIFLLT